MEKDKIIIIALIAVLAVLVVGIGYMLLNPSIEYESIHLSNGTSIEVPKADDSTWNKDTSGIRTYACPSKRTTLMSFNSQEDLSLVGAGAFALAREALMDGATDVEMYKDYQIKENTINGTHYYIVYVSSNETHDNIVIGSGNLDILKHMLDSLVLGKPADGSGNATSTGNSAPAQSASDASSKNSEDASGRVNENTNDNGVGDNSHTDTSPTDSTADTDVGGYDKYQEEDGNDGEAPINDFNFG